MTSHAVKQMLSDQQLGAMKTKELAHNLELLTSRWGPDLAKWVRDNEFSGLDFLAFIHNLDLFDLEAAVTLHHHLPEELKHLRAVLFHAQIQCVWPWAPKDEVPKTEPVDQ